MAAFRAQRGHQDSVSFSWRHFLILVAWPHTSQAIVVVCPSISGPPEQKLLEVTSQGMHQELKHNCHQMEYFHITWFWSDRCGWQLEARAKSPKYNRWEDRPISVDFCYKISVTVIIPLSSSFTLYKMMLVWWEICLAKSFKIDLWTDITETWVMFFILIAVCFFPI